MSAIPPFADLDGIQTHKRFKITPFIREKKKKKHSLLMHVFRSCFDPFICLDLVLNLSCV